MVVTGQIYKVQTLVDGGIRLTIDLPESATAIIGRLAELQVWGVAVEVTLKPT